MNCPYCNASDTKVIDSRPAEDNSIGVSLQDLSPVSVARLSIESVAAFAGEAVETVPVVAGEEIISTEDDSKMILGLVLILAIAGGGGALIFILMKKQKSGKGVNLHRAS